MKLSEFQQIIEDTYGVKDRERGIENTFLWFTEEVGELARAINGRTSRDNLRAEFADVLAWLTTLASIAGVDIEAEAARRYGQGCPKCKAIPCKCSETRHKVARC
jgi:NTP pyrophosphatase (non-canonical NTP hydrolase)